MEKMDFERELNRRRDHVNEVIRSYLPAEEGFQYAGRRETPAASDD